MIPGISAVPGGTGAMSASGPANVPKCNASLLSTAGHVSVLGTTSGVASNRHNLTVAVVEH